MSTLLAKQLILSNSYWAMSKPVVEYFGVETAFMLSVLSEAEQMMSDKEGWFYQTAETIEGMSGLSRYKQDKCIEELEAEGLIIKDVRGLPAKRYFKFNNEKLASKLISILQAKEDVKNKSSKKSKTVVEENDKPEFKKVETNKELNIKNVNKESSSSEKPKEKTPTTTTDTRLLHRFYQDNFGVESPFVAENIEYWAKDLNTELVLEAMKRASLSNKPFRYAEAIMDKWYKNNIRTLEQVEAEDKQFQRKMQGQPETKTEYSTDWKDMIADLDRGDTD